MPDADLLWRAANRQALRMFRSNFRFRAAQELGRSPGLPWALGVLCFGLLVCVACETHSEPEVAPAHFVHDAYVWQRRWNGALDAALQQAQPYLRAWRVLGGEIGPRSSFIPVLVDLGALRRTQKPVVLVVRIDGRAGVKSLSAATASSIALLLQHWRKSDVGVQGLEIDFDCGVASLPRYAAFLRDLHTRIGHDVTLSITALPSWMGSPMVKDLLATVDESVLQVHAVSDPKRGLFDAKRACQWAQTWSTESSKPFRIALPTYWSKVTWDETGRVSSIESETPKYGRKDEGLELLVQPRDVQAAMEQLGDLHLRNLAGLVWFRLPTTEDRRAWSFATWRAVLLHQSIAQATRLSLRLQGDGSGTRNAYLMNVGEVDSELPRQITVDAEGCTYADAFFPYDTQKTGAGLRWTRNGNDLLKAGTQRLIGWARCSGRDWQSHVDF